MNKKISAAVFAALATQGSDAVAQSEDALSLDEVVVTAQRRTENIQNVPITVQALTTETLENLKVNTIDEFVKFLPNVQVASQGPTHGNFAIRGLSIGAAVLQGGGTVGQWPTVGLYLDDQAGVGQANAITHRGAVHLGVGAFSDGCHYSAPCTRPRKPQTCRSPL